ncbi:MAG: hypothetical protein C3F07_18665 [Anaerolineales bacterium]|nr:MAG: hypothetical protein C3F07_18665 [Anaerolineales bacterium]
MDPVKILKRAWHILWSYRALWVFGLILAIATAGSGGGGGGNNGTRYQFDSNETRQLPLPEDFRRGMEEFTREMERLFNEGPQHVDFPREQLTALIWIVVAFTLVMIVLGIIVAIARYVSETAVIRMVDEYESRDTKMSVREGFRIGWSRTSWRLFLINLIVNLPAILLTLILLSAGIGIFFAVENGNLTFNAFSIITLIGLVFLLIFVVAILSIFLRLLRHFFWRVSALEDLGVQESLSRGWALVRENWKSVGLMWLVMVGLGIAWAIASIILFIITIPVVILTAAIALLVSAIPALLLVGIFNLFLSNVLAWVLGIVFVLPLFFTIAFSPWLLLGSWQTVFTSTVWTLTYREIKALPAVETPAELPAAS